MLLSHKVLNFSCYRPPLVIPVGTTSATAAAPKTPPAKAEQAATPARPVKKRKFSGIESEEDAAEVMDGSGGKHESDSEAADDD